MFNAGDINYIKMYKSILRKIEQGCVEKQSIFVGPVSRTFNRNVESLQKLVYLLGAYDACVKFCRAKIKTQNFLR